MIIVKPLITESGIIYGTIEYNDTLKKSDAIKDTTAPRLWTVGNFKTK